MAAWLAAMRALSRPAAGWSIDLACARQAFCLRGRRVCRSGHRLDRDHVVGVHLAILIADRDVFARAEQMRAEAITVLVVVHGGLVVIEEPARVLGSARLVHQETGFVVLAFPEPAHAAIFTMLAPERDVDMALVVERGDEFVTMPRRALRELLGAGEIEPDAFERMRQRGHGRVSIVDNAKFVVAIMAACGQGAY